MVPSPILGLADAPIVETKFLELAMSLLDLSPRIPFGTFSILLVKARNTTLEEAKEKYRGVVEIQRSGDKTSPGKIGLDIRTHASPKVGQDQVSGGVSVLCWHAAPIEYVLWKPCTIRLKVKFGNKV